MRYTITIEGLTFDTIIGILEHERSLPQKVVLDIAITYRYEKGAFIDYAEVCNIIKEHFRSRHFELLEDALASTADMLHDRFDAIEELTLTVAKPSILPDATPKLTLSLKYR